jgi:predicted nucleic acid-binding protein
VALVIADTSCLIALERIGRLDLIPALIADVGAPPAVIDEFGAKPGWLRVSASVSAYSA